VGEALISETLPVQYRSVLDAVARLEHRGHRDEAGFVRAEATRAYSGAWNDSASRRLRALLERAERVASGRQRARGGRHADAIRRFDLERLST
jgi:hypothetical protein